MPILEMSGSEPEDLYFQRLHGDWEYARRAMCYPSVRFSDRNRPFSGQSKRPRRSGLREIAKQKPKCRSTLIREKPITPGVKGEIEKSRPLPESWRKYCRP